MRKPIQFSQHNFYSKWIRFLRILLPIVIIILLASLFLWKYLFSFFSSPSLGSLKDQFHEQIKTPSTPQDQKGRISISEPYFTGKTKEKQFYKITAQKALTSNDGKDEILLEQPRAVLLLSKTERLFLSSKEGSVNQKKNSLNLEGSVHVRNTEGYEFFSTNFFYDSNTQQGQATGPIKGMGPAGTITGEELSLDRKKQLVRLKGKTSAVFYPTPKTPLSPPKTQPGKAILTKDKNPI